ncbi:MAG: hypothetical protein QOH46_3324, partial [Solirubrobacteraceae bacterium]|nr:hypothetical protein [Solirubrobacteraceae bacterium]
VNRSDEVQRLRAAEVRVVDGDGDRLLFGHVVNRSGHVARLRAADVHVRDADGGELRTSAAYAGGFVPGVSLRGYGDEMFGGDGMSAGREITLGPGQAAPLSVSFTVARGESGPVAIEYGEGTLALE